MKKIFTLALLALVALAANADVRKWDFTNWSTASAIQAASNWTDDEKGAGDVYVQGKAIMWNLGAFTADGAAIPEVAGLTMVSTARAYAVAIDYQTCQDANAWGPYAGKSYLWCMGTGSTIVVPNVTPGSKLTVGIESHKPSEARGVTFTANGVTSEAVTTIAYEEFAWTYNGEGTTSVTITPTKGMHIYFISVDGEPAQDDPGIDEPGEIVPTLGTPVFNLRENQRVNAETMTTLSIAFPNAMGIEGAATAEMAVEGKLVSETETVDIELGGMLLSGAFNEEIILAEATKYTFEVYNIYVTDETGEPILEKLTEDGAPLYTLHFRTRGGVTEDRKLEWVFENSAEDVEKMAVNEDYWAFVSKNNRYQNTVSYNDEELMLNADEKLPMTEGLFFTTVGETLKNITIGSPATASYNRLQLGGSGTIVTIPDCAKGDEITIEACYATKNKGTIVMTNALQADSLASTVSLASVGSKAPLVIIVQDNSDVVLNCKEVVFYTIKIRLAGEEKQNFEYKVNAVNEAGDVLATFDEGEALEGTVVKGAYPMWLNDNGSLVKSSQTNKEFNYAFTINEAGDQNIQYKKTGEEGIIYVAEAENITGTELCTNANAAIRCSNSKAAFITEDLVITNLPAGTYKIGVQVFDANKGNGNSVYMKLGEQVITFTATADNISVATSEEIILNEPTDLVWAATGELAPEFEGDAPIAISGGGERVGIDALYVQDYEQHVATGVQAPGIHNVASKAVIYNLAGQKVASNFKGIMIMNGKKFVK